MRHCIVFCMLIFLIMLIVSCYDSFLDTHTHTHTLMTRRGMIVILIKVCMLSEKAYELYSQPLTGAFTTLAPTVIR